MSSETNPRSVLENVVFVLSLVAIAALVGMLVYDGVVGPSGPPDVRVAVDTVATARPEIVPVRVENRGGDVAEAVRIEVCDARGACAQIDLDYVPSGATRRGVVGFRRPPEAPLTSRVVSFLTP